jgi:hypothetical protein
MWCVIQGVEWRERAGEKTTTVSLECNGKFCDALMRWMTKAIKSGEVSTFGVEHSYEEIRNMHGEVVCRITHDRHGVTFTKRGLWYQGVRLLSTDSAMAMRVLTA